MQGVNLKVIGGSALYFRIVCERGSFWLTCQSLQGHRKTLDNALLLWLYIAPVISHGLWFFIILGVGIWLLSIMQIQEFQLLMWECTGQQKHISGTDTDFFSEAVVWVHCMRECYVDIRALSLSGFVGAVRRIEELSSTTF
jgi:hypothetical protein